MLSNEYLGLKPSQHKGNYAWYWKLSQLHRVTKIIVLRRESLTETLQKTIISNSNQNIYSCPQR